ncbi:hypothetical protein J4205_02980 [Candidatus Pacearchaeota archaeon]|nr:hypothetical protein [Candidatus Pacearchaeota archaeon]
MKKNIVLASLVAILAVAFVASIVAATSSLDVNVHQIEVDGLDATSNNVAIVAGTRVPVTLDFTANENASDVVVSAWFQGERSGTFVENDFADLIEGREYRLRLSVNVPSDVDPEEELTLFVRVETDSGNYEEELTLQGQRMADDLEVLLVDFESNAKPGETVPITVVLKNMGRQEAEDTFVTVKIPELGISRSAYFEDLSPVDVCDSNDGECDQADSRERRLFITIPEDAKSGKYEMSVRAYNSDTETVVTKSLTVSAPRAEGSVLSNPTSKQFAVGQETSYDLVLVNSGNKIAIYNLAPTTSDALSIRLSEPVAIVPAGSSKIVKVYVTANREGTFPFSVSAISDSFTKEAQYLATVEGRALSGGSTSSNIVALTIVLAIIFVVLVVILVVLLTRRPEKTEEFGESYY